jgi:hypothetical protein
MSQGGRVKRERIRETGGKSRWGGASRDRGSSGVKSRKGKIAVKSEEFTES